MLKSRIQSLAPSRLMLMQVLTHSSIPFMIYYGAAHNYVASFLVYFLTGCLGMSMTYHRLLSHRSWDAPLWFERLGTVIAAYGLTGTPIAWSAIHRQHHRFSDRERDPHSPWIYSFWRVQFLSLLPKPRLKIVSDLVADPFQRAIHRYYFLGHAVILAGFLVFYPFGAVYLYLFPSVLLWHGGSLINTMGHKIGYRNFPTGDHSTNNPVLGFLMWGEGWHNNHHRFPARASFRVRWFEFDLSGVLIGIIGRK